MEKLVFLETPKGLMGCDCGKETGIAQSWSEVSKILWAQKKYWRTLGKEEEPPPFCNHCLRYCRQVLPGILTLLMLKEDPPMTAAGWELLLAENKRIKQAFAFAQDVGPGKVESSNPSYLRRFQRVVCREEA